MYLALPTTKRWEVVAIRGLQVCLWSERDLQFRIEDRGIVETSIERNQWVKIHDPDWRREG